MSKRFSKVYGGLWRSKRFSDLGSSDAKLAYFYLLTCEHVNSAGCYVIPDGYAIADLGWELKRYQAARDELVSVALIAFDAETSTVYIERWFKHSPAMNEKHAQGILRIISEIESEELQLRVGDDFEASESLRTRERPRPEGGGTDRLMNTGFLNGRGAAR